MSLPGTDSTENANRSYRPQSPRRRRLFIVLCLLSPLFLFGLAEGLFRCMGFGGYPHLLRPIGTMDERTMYITDTKAASSYFFANRSRPGSMFENDLLIPKPTGTLRILFCGESAAKGFPQPREFSAGAFLEEMLRDLLPERKVEVINIATTAVASFPILGLLKEAMAVQPDLVVIYCGNNEFFGAYGVASLHSAGRSPTMMRIQRSFRSTAVAQVIDYFYQNDAPADNRALMEVVVGKAHIAVDDPLRADAARNLHDNISDMIALCRQVAIPVIVCTPPANEADMAPLGSDDLSALPAAKRVDVEKLCSRALPVSAEEADRVLPALEGALKDCPDHARLHYLRGRALQALSRFDEARGEFDSAVSLDPMPWRPPAANIEAIRNAVNEGGAQLCDLIAAFRAQSPGGCIGWSLMDDHVHPSLHGQAVVAKAMVGAMSQMSGPAAIAKDAAIKLAPWESYAKRLGDNPYERYGVAHTLRVLCNVPFIRATNPGAYERYDKYCKDFEATLSRPLLEVAKHWQDPKTHSGNIQRPISAMVGRVLIGEKKYAEAESLFATAIRGVPPYSSLNLEYTYFRLAAREKLHPTLGEADRQAALEAIERGKYLLAHGFAGSGMTERYIGRLHQLRHEFAESIPYLLEARARLNGTDRLAADQALIVSYVQTKQQSAARDFLQKQIESNPQAAIYQQILQQLQEQPQLAPSTGP